MVEHQLPKLRAAGSNPVFRSKPQQDEASQCDAFFCTRTSWDVHIPRWKSIKKARAASAALPHPATSFESAPAASGTGMPEDKPRLPIQTRPFPYNLSGKNISKNSSAKHLPCQFLLCALDEVLFWKVQQFCCTFQINILYMPCRAHSVGR